MSKHSPWPGDPFADLREWQDHRYDPGYFTSGRIHPILKGSRPNRYGWVLLLGAFFCFAFFLLPHGESAWWQYVLVAAYGFLWVVAGIRLLKRQPDHSPRASSHHRSRRTRKGHP